MSRLPTIFVSLGWMTLACLATAVAQEGESSPPTRWRSPPRELAEPDAPDEAQAEQAGDEAELSPAARALRDPLRHCLAHYLFHPETPAERGPWGVMHAIMAFGVDARLDLGQQEANAIGWLCWNRPCYGRQLFSVDGGQVIPRMGPGYQGHDGQFLQIMALACVPRDYAIKVDGNDFTIADVVRYEQATCRAGEELTFKLIGLVHYLGTNATWRNDRGELWSIERLIKEELSQPVVGAACGGTHRMMGFGYAARRRRERDEPMTGQWARAKRYLDDYVLHAYRLQNSDGSFSTNWFEDRGDAAEIEVRLETTGHTLEWLLLSLPEDQLTDPRLVRAAQSLTDLLWEHRGHSWEIGPKGHALHALVLYDERVFGAKPGEHRVELARVAKEKLR